MTKFDCGCRIMTDVMTLNDRKLSNVMGTTCSKPS